MKTTFVVLARMPEYEWPDVVYIGSSRAAADVVYRSLPDTMEATVQQAVSPEEAIQLATEYMEDA